MKVSKEEVMMFIFGLIIGFTISLTATWWVWKYCLEILLLVLK